MAKILEMPGERIISGFKGTLDFYYYMGVACVRKWPSSPGHNRAPAVQAQWEAFTSASRLWGQLSIEIRQAYETLASTSALSGKDLFTQAYISGTYRYPHTFTP